MNIWHSLETRWGWVMHICVCKPTIIGSDNGLSPGRRQAIIWTNAGILLIWPLGTNFSEILIEIQTFSLKKICLKMPSQPQYVKTIQPVCDSHDICHIWILMRWWPEAHWQETAEYHNILGSYVVNSSVAFPLCNEVGCNRHGGHWTSFLYLVYFCIFFSVFS